MKRLHPLREFVIATLGSLALFALAGLCLHLLGRFLTLAWSFVP